MPKQNCRKGDASVKNGMMSHCKCLFEWIGANLAHIQPKIKAPKCPKMCFWSKALRVNGLIEENSYEAWQTSKEQTGMRIFMLEGP